MSRVCELTGKKVHYGRNVSHSNRKTSRTFEPNLQPAQLQSDALGRSLRLQVSTRALRTVTKKGGLDPYLLATPDDKLPERALRLKREIQKKLRS